MTRREYSYVAGIIATLIATVLYAALRILPHHGFDRPNPGTPPAERLFYEVTRVVDGDTLKLANGERIRLIGVDTPEAHYSKKLVADARRSRMDTAAIKRLGRRASAFTKNLCFGKKVRLEYDVERRDRYGRILAYVYLDDGTFVNAKIVSEGYGQVMTVPPNVKYADTFLRLEREAQSARRGLWGERADAG